MRRLLVIGALGVVCVFGRAQARAPQSQSGSAAPQAAPANAAPEMIPLYGEPISLDRAKRVMAAAETEAKRLNVSPALAIVDSTGHLVMFQRLDNSDYGNGGIAIVLARSAVEFRRSTKEFGDTVEHNPTIAFLPGVVPYQGGWPILTNGRLVGALGVVGTRGGRSENGKTSNVLVGEAGVNAGK
jgi:glc operon protein GlcG